MVWAIILNYIAWYLFVFIAVVWILVLLQNRNNFSSKGKELKKLPFVSVLIPAYNEGKTISKTIRSVLNLDYPKRLLEIIVINDCSTDDTKEMAEGFRGKGVKILNNRRNRGKAYSLNRATRIAKGKYIACIDADSLVERDALKKMLYNFDSPDIAAVTPALKVWKPKKFLEKAQHAEYLLNIFLRKMLAFLDSIHVTPGVFSIYRKDILLKVGGFEEGNLTEDMDIALKIHEHGYKIENNLNAVSYTVCPDKWKAIFKQRLRWYRGAIQNTIKYKHLLFRKKYGNLGFFFVPMNFLAVIAIISIFVSLVWSYGTMVADSVWKMSLIGWDFSLIFEKMNIFTFFGSFINTPFLLGTIGLLLGGYLLYISFRFSNENIRSNKPGYLLYLIIFPFIYMVFWAAAMLCEVIGLKRKW